MTVLSAPPLKQRFYDTDGVTPLSGGRVFTYATGTTTPQATYSNRAGTSANSNPIILDSNGEAVIYLTPSLVYDFVVMRPAPDSTVVQTSAGIYTFGGDDEFTQDGTGAVPLPVSDVLKDWISVTQFGAVGDGVTDDTAAFTNATATGKPVFVPKTSAHYAVTALTDVNRELLWGPGRVKLSGSDVIIPSQPRTLGSTFPGVYVLKSAWSPDKWPTVDGSLTNGAAYFDLVRTGGFATYGALLNQLRVTAATPTGQLDVAETAWATHNNLTGGQVFGSWFGANTPAASLSQTYSGGAAIGCEINVGNRWADFGLQNDVGGTRYTVGLQMVPDVLPASDGTNTLTVSNITIATPGVVTVTAHGLPAWTGIVFEGTGTLPTGLVKGQLYYVASAGLATDTFQVASTVGGASINTTGTFAGPITIRPSYAGSFAFATSESVWAHRWWTVDLIRTDTIMAGGYGHRHYGGSIAAMAPAAWVKVEGNWTRGWDARSVAFGSYGIDLQGATFGTAWLNLPVAVTATTATGGARTLPANPAGFIITHIDGVAVKLPYYNN